MESLLSIFLVVVIICVIYLAYKVTRPLSAEQIEDREKQKKIYQNLAAQRKVRQQLKAQEQLKLKFKKFQADNTSKTPNTQEGMVRVTERIKSELSESEIKAAISKEFQSIDPSFDKVELTLRGGFQKPIIAVDVTRVDQDWLVSAKYDPNYNLNNSEDIVQKIIFVALLIGCWVFASGTVAMVAGFVYLIFRALIKTSFGNDRSSSLDIAKNIERCLQNLKNEFSTTT